MNDWSLTDFVWKNKCRYMKKSVILNSYNKGGLNLIDFSSLNYTFKINWLNQYLKSQYYIWYIFPQQTFSDIGDMKFLLMWNYNKSKIPVKLSNLHQQELLALIYKHNFTPPKFFIWTIKVFYTKIDLYFLINGLVMVWF